VTDRLAIDCPTYLRLEEEMRRLTGEINRATGVAEKAAEAEKLKARAEALLSCAEYDGESWNCGNCRGIASLKVAVSEVIIQVSKGDVASGLSRLSSLINQLKP